MRLHITPIGGIARATARVPNLPALSMRGLGMRVGTVITEPKQCFGIGAPLEKSGKTSPAIPLNAWQIGLQKFELTRYRNVWQREFARALMLALYEREQVVMVPPVLPIGGYKFQPLHIASTPGDIVPRQQFIVENVSNNINAPTVTIYHYGNVAGVTNAVMGLFSNVVNDLKLSSTFIDRFKSAPLATYAQVIVPYRNWLKLFGPRKVLDKSDTVSGAFDLISLDQFSGDIGSINTGGSSWLGDLWGGFTSLLGTGLKAAIPLGVGLGLSTWLGGSNTPAGGTAGTAGTAGGTAGTAGGTAGTTGTAGAIPWVPIAVAGGVALVAITLITRKK
jgi:hypothetical protein